MLKTYAHRPGYNLQEQIQDYALSYYTGCLCDSKEELECYIEIKELNKWANK